MSVDISSTAEQLYEKSHVKTFVIKVIGNGAIPHVISVPISGL